MLNKRIKPGQTLSSPPITPNPRLMRRIVIPELLDDDLGTAAEIAQTLTDLRHINQWFGECGPLASYCAKSRARLVAGSSQYLKWAPEPETCRWRRNAC